MVSNNAYMCPCTCFPDPRDWLLTTHFLENRSGLLSQPTMDVCCSSCSPPAAFSSMGIPASGTVFPFHSLKNRILTLGYYVPRGGLPNRRQSDMQYHTHTIHLYLFLPQDGSFCFVTCGDLTCHSWTDFLWQFAMIKHSNRGGRAYKAINCTDIFYKHVYIIPGL